MATSDKTPEDKQKFKNALIGVIVLLAIGSFGSMLITEVTGVDVENLCQTNEDGEERCIDNEDIKSVVSDLFYWSAIGVAGIGFFVLIIAGIKY